VLIESASSAVNSVVRSLQFAPGEKMLYLNIAYDMVKVLQISLLLLIAIKSVIEYTANVGEEQTIQVQLEFPTSPSAIVSAVQQAIESNTGGSIKFARYASMAI
jgi:hypothetical protein